MRPFKNSLLDKRLKINNKWSLNYDESNEPNTRMCGSIEERASEYATIRLQTQLI